MLLPYFINVSTTPLEHSIRQMGNLEKLLFLMFKDLSLVFYEIRRPKVAPGILAK